MTVILRSQNRDTMFRGFFKIPGNFLHLLKKCRGKKAEKVREKDLKLFDFSDLTPEDLEAFGLKLDTMHRQRINDVSFLTADGKLIILVEHQTILTPNLALKIFLYYTELIQLWMAKNKINLHTAKHKIEPPVPEVYIAYNGSDEIKEEYSRFNVYHQESKIDVKVPIIDIRYENLEDKDPENSLTGYAYFHKRKDDFTKEGLSGEDAFMKAREECIDKGYLKGFIEKEEFIVLYKNIFDYDEQLRSEGWLAGMAEGEAKGKAEGQEIMLRIAIKSNASEFVLKTMARESNVPPERLQQLIKEVKGFDASKK